MADNVDNVTQKDTSNSNDSDVEIIEIPDYETNESSDDENKNIDEIEIEEINDEEEDEVDDIEDEECEEEDDGEGVYDLDGECEGEEEEDDDDDDDGEEEEEEEEENNDKRINSRRVIIRRSSRMPIRICGSPILISDDEDNDKIDSPNTRALEEVLKTPKRKSIFLYETDDDTSVSCKCVKNDAPKQNTECNNSDGEKPSL